MTDAARRIAIMGLIKEHTAAKLVSREVARSSLIKEGIYNASGKVKSEFGGEPVKAKTAA